jgi:DNA-directed RNA polymerase subunit beta'
VEQKRNNKSIVMEAMGVKDIYYHEIKDISAVDAFDAIRITVASPDMIRSWSHGEVKNPETINYRTYKPEPGGLFCERIFGPTKDWECSCGKYKRIKHKGVVCDRCGVEVTVSRVRRERMGHIELAVPVSHIWFFKCTPSRLGLMLDMPVSSLERVLYYEDYMVTEPGDTPLKLKQLLSETEYREALEKYGETFEAKMGAEAVKDVLERIDLDVLMEELQSEMEKTQSKHIRKKLSKRMKLVEGFRNSGTRPEWMILQVLPVLPPDLRPLVPIEGGRFATSDLNDLYRRVINRNNRLRNLLQLKTPDVILRNEKRMLQEAVDALLDNGRQGRPVTGAGNRPLKSLGDMLRGKTGRFRQNLLGKRVDYSGRAVIVVGPELKLYQCGLPKKMALVLFEPFIIKCLRKRGIAHTVRSAKRLIEQKSEEVWNILEEVIKGKTVMLNRAPTLHRLSIQSFEPVLIEGEAIRIHPLVCTAYNADFDGDQMAVHVPLSIEAELESRLLMLSTNSIFSPANGKSIMTPTQDITLGVYYLTTLSQADKRAMKNVKQVSDQERLPLMASINEVKVAYDEGDLKIHSRIRLKNPDYGRETVFGDKTAKVLITTVGRVFFNEIWPAELGFVNKTVDKTFLGTMIMECYKVAGHARTVKVLDDLKDLGFFWATKSGSSIGINDAIIPEERERIIEEAAKKVVMADLQYRSGVITEGERHNKIVDIWTDATEKISNAMYRAIEENAGSDEINPLFMMVASKARGSKQQIRQLGGIRGLMAKPSGEIIERPILANLREGLSVQEYFYSSHGARKGLADTALKTADAGYLTRKLVDVAHEVIIVEYDCNTLNGVEVSAIIEGDEELVSLEYRILGRTALYDIKDPLTNEIIVRGGEEIDETACEKIRKAGLRKVKIRTCLTCEARNGVCAKCYGRDLSTGKTVELGVAVGIIAAQSIGEPGTQLTMRTFHIGGTASAVFKQPEIWAKNDGIIRYEGLRVVKTLKGENIVLNKNGSIILEDEKGHELERYGVSIGTVLLVEEGKTVKKNQCIAKWDPYSVPILAEQAGIVSFHDFITGVSVKREVSSDTGQESLIVLETKENLHPQIVIKDEKTNEILGFYSVPAGAHVVVHEGDKVQPGDLLAKTPRKEAKTRDITGGLPRVAELFEARIPKNAAEIARIEGIVDFEPTQRGKRVVVVKDETTGQKERHFIPMSKHIVVFKGDRVKKGQPLTEGAIVPEEILEICGPQELQEYLVNEIQEVYRLQGVEINDKHIEIIVRQMLRKVRITDPGDTELLWGEYVSKERFLEINEKAIAQGKRPAEASAALLGITKASLETESFISAASFQDTARVLTEAATLGKIDTLRAFKENIIMGHLMPGGTGFHLYRKIKLVPLGEPVRIDETKSASAEAGKRLMEVLGE